MYSRGFIPKSVCWRGLDGTKLGGLGIDTVFPDDYPHKMVCFPLDKLGPVLYEHITRVPQVRVHWSHNIVNIGQDDYSAWVEIETPEGVRKKSADYVVGCDGGRSIVRRTLFGDDFPGFTWYEQIVATNVLTPFARYPSGNETHEMNANDHAV